MQWNSKSVFVTKPNFDAVEYFSLKGANVKTPDE